MTQGGAQAWQTARAKTWATHAKHQTSTSQKVAISACCSCTAVVGLFITTRFNSERQSQSLHFSLLQQTVSIKLQCNSTKSIQPGSCDVEAGEGPSCPTKKHIHHPSGSERGAGANSAVVKIPPVRPNPFVRMRVAADINSHLEVTPGEYQPSITRWQPSNPRRAHPLGRPRGLRIQSNQRCRDCVRCKQGRCAERLFHAPNLPSQPNHLSPVRGEFGSSGRREFHHMNT